MRRLHPQQGIRLQPERFLEPDRHFGRQALPPVEQLAHRLARHAKAIRRVGYRERKMIDHIALEPGPGMNREARMKLDRHAPIVPLRRAPIKVLL